MRSWCATSTRPRGRDGADRALRAGRSLGQLHGVPMTIKESYDIAGLRHLGHPGIARQHRATDSEAVRRFKCAGATSWARPTSARACRLPELQRHIRHHQQSLDVTRGPGGSSAVRRPRSPLASPGSRAARTSAARFASRAFLGVYGHTADPGASAAQGHALRACWRRPTSGAWVRWRARLRTSRSRSASLPGPTAQRPRLELDLPEAVKRSLAEVPGSRCVERRARAGQHQIADRAQQLDRYR